MTTEGAPEQSPWTRPGFIVAAVVVVIIVVVGVVLGVRGMSGDDDAAPAPTSSRDPAPSPTATASVDGGQDASVCGLDGEKLSGTLSTAPAAEWAYQGSAAYPTSPEFGPAAADPAGFRYCFQHSPEGALFAAAYAVTIGSDPTLAPDWLNYFTAPGPHRDELLRGASAAGGSTGDDLRMRVAGFRLLEYSGDAANVDVAVTASVNGQAVTMSAIYPLTWTDGDWKLSTETSDPGSVVGIPNLAGYIAWGE